MKRFAEKMAALVPKASKTAGMESKLADFSVGTKFRKEFQVMVRFMVRSCLLTESTTGLTILPMRTWKN
jgi:hypothetical protein